MTSAANALPPDDLALLDRVAAKIVTLRLELPAILTLETGRPLSLLASQTMIFLEPIVAAILRLPDYRRFAQLIERRESVEGLIRAIDVRADAAVAERRAADRARRAARAATRGGKA